jgi:hypothetical protein
VSACAAKAAPARHPAVAHQIAREGGWNQQFTGGRRPAQPPTPRGRRQSTPL